MFEALRGRRLDRDVQRSLTEIGGGAARALAWGRDARGRWCVLSRAGLFVGEPGEWKRWRWPEVENGSWNNDLRTLKWKHSTGTATFRPDGDPRDIPLVFKELVESSILVAEHVEIPETRNGGDVAGRRDPGDPSAPIVWTATLGRGTKDTPENRAVLDDALAALRAQYE